MARLLIMNLFGNPTVEFCEKVGGGLIKRPFYAISNIAYLAIGLTILSRGTKLSKHFGFLALFIAVASFLYDASYTYLSQLVDLLGMLIFVNLLVNLSSQRYFKVSTKRLLLIQSTFIVLGIGIIFYFKSFAGEFVFGSFVIAEIILELLLWFRGKTKEIKLWFYGFFTFSLGFIIWLFDASGGFCDPHNIVNGRSIFHILTAFSIYLLYKYFEEQELLPKSLE
jgi:hypothetical protein